MELTSYHTLSIAKYLHISHKTFGYDSTLNQINMNYLETFIFLILTPLAFLCLVIAFSIFLYKCFFSKIKTSHIKYLLCHLIFITLSAIVLGIQGNIIAHKSFNNIKDSLGIINDKFVDLQVTIRKIDTLLHNITSDIYKIRKFKPSEKNVRNKFEISIKLMDNFIRNLLNHIYEIDSNLIRIDFNSYTNYASEYEYFIVLFIFIVFSIFIWLLILLLCGIFKNSSLLRCFVLLDMLATLISWLFICAYLGISTFTSDICINPRPFFLMILSNSERLDYYILCKNSTKIYFDQELNDIKIFLENINIQFNNLNYICSQHCNNLTILNSLNCKIVQVEIHVHNFNENSRCQVFYKDYINFMNYLCKDFLKGSVIVFFAFVINGFMSIFLVMFTLSLWENTVQTSNALAKNEELEDSAPQVTEPLSPLLTEASSSSVTDSSPSYS